MSGVAMANEQTSTLFTERICEHTVYDGYIYITITEKPSTEAEKHRCFNEQYYINTQTYMNHFEAWRELTVGDKTYVSFGHLKDDVDPRLASCAEDCEFEEYH